MAEPDAFRYLSFAVKDDGRTVDFTFQLSLGEAVYNLTETLTFPVVLPSNAVVNRGLRALHLALGISYYKTFLQAAISHPYQMEGTEAEFWNDVFVNGLGEFLYVNKLPEERVAHFSAQDGLQYEDTEGLHLQPEALLGIGGGKDSIVAGETLKKVTVPVTGFVMATGEHLGQTQAVAEVMSVELLAVGRTLDPQLLVLQEQPGAYKGHVPISLIFALVGSVLALAQNKAYVVVANEASASIPGVIWNGKEVNHQWSKSFGFERNLQAYLQARVAPDLTYFSVIRPLSSIAVARRFADYPQYFEVFTSDNSLFRIDPTKRPPGRWSLESPKSLSSFILLAPWIQDKDMERIFGRNFLNEPSLEPLFLRLIGVEGEPPLDCVGTIEELVVSLNLLASAHRYSDTALMSIAKERGVIKDNEELWRHQLDMMLMPSLDHAFPDDLAVKLQQELGI